MKNEDLIRCATIQLKSPFFVLRWMPTSIIWCIICIWFMGFGNHLIMHSASFSIIQWHKKNLTLFFHVFRSIYFILFSYPVFFLCFHYFLYFFLRHNFIGCPEASNKTRLFKKKLTKEHSFVREFYHYLLYTRILIITNILCILNWLEIRLYIFDLNYRHR